MTLVYIYIYNQRKLKRSSLSFPDRKGKKKLLIRIHTNFEINCLKIKRLVINIQKKIAPSQKVYRPTSFMFLGHFSRLNSQRSSQVEFNTLPTKLCVMKDFVWKVMTKSVPGMNDSSLKCPAVFIFLWKL